MIDDELKNLINEFLASGTPFAVVRLPGEQPRIIGLGSQEGLKITPWLGGRFSKDVQNHTDPSQYLEQLEALIALLNKTGGKTVLSRIIGVDVSHVDWADAAEALWSAFPQSFGYLISSDKWGGWLGASPETLLVVRPDGEIYTHALAGTVGLDENWDEKNKKEQRIVGDYIADKLDKNGINYTKGETFDLIYGGIKHLCTPFIGHLPDNFSPQKLLENLAPTPALAGYPLEDALSMIKKLEKHSRGLYGGYITIVNSEVSYSFVTIRCVQFDLVTGKGAVYVGSGITADSEPLKELEETDRKARVLLDILIN